MRGHIGQDRLNNFGSQHTQDNFCEQVGVEEYSGQDGQAVLGDQDREEDLICQENFRQICREDFCDQDRQEDLPSPVT